MEKKALIMLRVLINRYHKGSTDKILDPLSQDTMKKVLDQNIRSDDVASAIKKPERILEKIHYSWMIEPLKKISPLLQPYFLQALSEEKKEYLKQALEQELPEIPLSPPVKSFFLEELAKQMNVHEVIPASYLPKTPLLPLAYLSKKKLERVIDLLGIYDLANEIRQVINKQHLQHLYKCLSKLRLKYLNIVMYLPEKFTHEKLGIEEYRGDQKRLERVLHKRGLIRLAKALSGEKQDLLWHINHILDTGRTTVLQKFSSEKEIPILTQALIQQTLHALNFMEKEDKNLE